MATSSWMRAREVDMGREGAPGQDEGRAVWEEPTSTAGLGSANHDNSRYAGTTPTTNFDRFTARSVNMCTMQYHRGEQVLSAAHDDASAANDSGVSRHPPKPPRCAAHHMQDQYRRGTHPYCFTRKYQESSIASQTFHNHSPRLARDACRVHTEHSLAFLDSAVCERDADTPAAEWILPQR
ncbi:hypothetical protein SNOG_04335 [Parastagonospora nodorum SN15]|uniref:Uncharacterized protein n=1 Tax=Phaeosphaeria nodorum (strain SN15 / ATCC MYA-4574 / FGSC 10173) TaxID=321614 RepID=Q0UV79_PHANO|nr:hypothetical protein SNOG_04335 [Parastagonospora nodorum SN15]EAT88095.1 hypothetical protein SNOG_04335 [Parastagonospora nodorum SN15]